MGRIGAVVLRFVLRVAWLLFTLAVGTVAAWWVGVPTATRRVADEWVKRIGYLGLSSQYDMWLYRVARFLALLTVLGGWVVAAYLTVLILGMVA